MGTLQENDFKKAMLYVDKLTILAEKERDEKGYRENLGFDNENKLTKYLETLNLSYLNQSIVYEYFYNSCYSI